MNLDKLSDGARVLLLLASYLEPGESRAGIKPLTIREWARFEQFLAMKKIPLDGFLGCFSKSLLAEFQDKSITYERLDLLARRPFALGVALDKWNQVGIWVCTREDASYPQAIRNKLKEAAPPFFYGCGNIDLLNYPGVGVVGSRNVPETELQVSKKIGGVLASSNKLLVSGGAKGVDSTSMLACLRKNGRAVAVLADSLVKRSQFKAYREFIRENSLCLISSFYPEAGFFAGNAMARNRYIYAMCDDVIVVHSGVKGGTWAGANENLKNKWAETWVVATTDTTAGNVMLQQMGGRGLPDSFFTDGVLPERATKQASRLSLAKQKGLICPGRNFNT